MAASTDAKVQPKRERLVDYALTYLSFGFVPIGLNGKRPLLGGWQNTPRDKALELIATNSKAGKINNVGILAGKASGVVVVDVDLRENGIEQWHKMAKDKGLPETFTVLTGSGGYHYYFLYDERMSLLGNTKLIGLGIDFKTDGGQLVAPGSIHPDTKKIYAVQAGYKDGKPLIARMPNWLFELILANQKK